MAPVAYTMPDPRRMLSPIPAIKRFPTAQRPSATLTTRSELGMILYLVSVNTAKNVAGNLRLTPHRPRFLANKSEEISDL